MIGIDISDRSIKVAEITASPGQMALRTVCWSPLLPDLIHRGVIQDVPAVSGALRDAFAKCSPFPLDGRAVVASIPETQSFVRVLEVPDMSSREMDEAIQWAVRQHIPFDLDRVYLDWQLLPALRDARRREVLVGAAQRAVVDPLLEVLDGANLQVVGLELEAQAIVRSLLPKQAADVFGVLIIDLGATYTNIIFFDGGAMRFTTSVQFGGDHLTQQLARSLHMQPSIAAEKKAMVGLKYTSGDDADVSLSLRQATIELFQAVEKVVRELIIQMQSGQAVKAILLSGGSANLPGILEVVSEVFPGIPVQMGNPWTNVFNEDAQLRAPLSPQDANHFVTAIGLALRPA